MKNMMKRINRRDEIWYTDARRARWDVDDTPLFILLQMPIK
jgi:hypothetical protein